MPAQLTKREIEIIELIADEFNTREIAKALFLSTETIKSHRKSIRTKLQVRNAAGAIRAAFQFGILSVPPLH